MVDPYAHRRRDTASVRVYSLQVAAWQGPVREQPDKFSTLQLLFTKQAGQGGEAQARAYSCITYYEIVH